MAAVVAVLQDVRNELSHDTERLAEKLHASLKSAEINEILDEGLHKFLTKFLACIGELGNGIGHDFLLPVAPELPEVVPVPVPAPTQSQTQSQTSSRTSSQTQTQSQTR